MDSGREPRPFDVVEINLGEAVGTSAQPENYLVSPTEWKFVEEVDEGARAAMLGALETDGPELFGSTASSVETTVVNQAPSGHSLTIVRPRDVRWELRPRQVGNLQLRALFKLGTAFYDLPVTDPIWYEHVRGQPSGLVSVKALSDVPTPTHLTVSLGEEWSGSHYKIVAAVHSVGD